MSNHSNNSDDNPVSSGASYPPGPNSDHRGDIPLTSAPNRRTGGNSSWATGAYSSSSTQAHSPRMSQHNARQNAPSPWARDTRMDHPASSSTGPSALPAENERAPRPHPPERKQSKRKRKELDDNVGSAEANTTNKSSPDRQQRAKVTTPSVGSSIAFRPINKAFNSPPVPASSEANAELTTNKYAHSGRCTTCGELLPSNNYSSPRCDECRRKVRKRKQAKKDNGTTKGTKKSGQKRKRRPKRMLPAQRWQNLTPPTRNRRMRKTRQMEWSSQNGSLQMMERMTLIWMELPRSSWFAYDLGHGLRDEEC
ncbi:uncharacterized protein B0T23DRAFT_404059 [Neurospora hispaniola]|uniref:Uncharacterized protein n=1 Tax=Neurospora hispaniola TaxID=588809 RepID=A0AAJ0MSZ9_9PEZI|nr:hypothetical protein B0T23DRAFT_404059 [Neurospora hispaniola]